MATHNNSQNYSANDAGALVGEIFSGGLSTSQAIEKLRTRLLDLSARNGLLNFRHPKGRCLQVVDDVSLNLVFDRLYGETKGVPFKHVPEPGVLEYEGKRPEAKIYASRVGINVSPEFEPNASIARGHRLHGIQTLLYPQELEKQLRKISGDANTAIEETGSNMLFMIFGFLEFYDSEDSDRALLAPILSLPVTLIKGPIDQEARTYQYTVLHNGEDLAENQTLREKLRRDFSLSIPEFDEENDSPEEYFKEIEKAISKKRRWRVRRQLTLGMLSFGKLAIWSDLDPKKNPALLENELIKSVFSGKNTASGESFQAEDYDIDKHPAANLQFIFDADSSQHSAIIDVLSGKNVVINGPPGTGKSQTITNIIATALAQRKKVLFVSEKLAALEVVRRRLNMANLGHFCLELHSHKTQKKKFLEDLEARIEAKFLAPSQLQNKLSQLQKQKAQLNRYAELMGSSVGNKLGLTVHEIFWASERRRQELDDLAAEVSNISFNDAANWSHDDLMAKKGVLDDLATLYEEIGRFDQDHPWWGFRVEQLKPSDDETINRIIANALESAAAADDAHQEILRSFDSLDPIGVELLHRIANDLQIITPADSQISVSLLPRLFNKDVSEETGAQSTALIEQLRRSLSRALELKHNADKAFADNPRLSKDDADKIANSLSAFIRKEVANLPISKVLVEIQEFKNSHSEFQQLIRTNSCKYAPVKEANLQQIAEALQSVKNHHISNHPFDSLESGFLALESAHASIVQALKSISEFCVQRKITFDASPNAIASLLEGNNFQDLRNGITVTTEDINLGNELINHPLSSRPISELKSLNTVIESEGVEINLASRTVKDILDRIATDLPNNETVYAELKTLIQIASKAPTELLDYRNSSFLQPRAAEVLNNVDEFLKYDSLLHTELEKIFYLDALPSNESISEAISVLRNKDGFFALFDSNWRAGKTLHRKLSRQERKITAKARAEELTQLLNWRKNREKFQSDSEPKILFGNLFRVLDTDTRQIRTLLDWMGSSRAKLAECNHLSPRIDMSQLNVNLIASLTANGSRIESAINRLSLGIETISKEIGPSFAGVKEARTQSLEKTIALFESEKDKLQKQINHFDKFAFSRLSPKLAQQQLIARDEMGLIRKELEILALAKSTLNEAGRSPFTRMLEGSALKWDTFLEELKRNLRDVGHALQLSKPLSTPTVTLNQINDLVTCHARLFRSWSQLLSIPDPQTFADWNQFTERSRNDLEEIESLYRTASSAVAPDLSLLECASAIASEVESAKIVHDLNASQPVMNLVAPVFQGLATDLALIERTLAWGKCVVSANFPKPIQAQILSKEAKISLETSQRLFKKASESINSVKTTLDELTRFGSFTWNQWQLQCKSRPGVDLTSEIRKRLEIANASANAVLSWSKYLIARETAQKNGVRDFLKLLEAERVPAPCLSQAFELTAYLSIGRSIYQAYPELNEFNPVSHDRIRSDFQKLDAEVIGITGREFAHRISSHANVPAGTRGATVGEYTEMNLLRREISKQRRHIPIRQLLKRAGHALQELKPVFMMGPMSVAQYLEMGTLEFDIVVMDEASQLRPEDAIGAVARGKQLVVVGDPKQLPPTSFFDRMSDSSDEDGEDEAPAAITGLESILDICQQLFTPTRSLRWHYRSQHESLIAFSNHHFYKNLVVFPSPYAKARKLGVKYRYLKNGIYKDRQNFHEAERIVDAVLDHMLKYSECSLGVVTLNQTQRELIEELLEKKLKTFPEGAAYRDKWEHEGWPFFVKNLENVQGDERDVIFISTTYGKAPGTTRPRQNFGPISRPDGWRRLNVLFTRSRQRIELFTSMLPEDIIVDEKTPLGTKALRDYLDFAKRGVLVTTDDTDREPDSDFEVSVADVIRSIGYDVKPQLGVAGFFIDMVVRNPDRPGEYLAAIECDGATYHSGFSVRDRDRIRQEILESLGWKGKIFRIWSTDWFYNPRESIQKLHRFLDGRRNQALLEESVELDTADAEDDPDSVFELRDVYEVGGATVAEDPEFVTDAFDGEYIEVGDRVTYCHADEPGVKHTVWITDGDSNAKLGIINEQSPLAQALLGLCEGESGELETSSHQGRKTSLVKVLKILTIDT
jgi:very-short-patch-repair endonuclease